jgi:hypothetical protein
MSKNLFTEFQFKELERILLFNVYLIGLFPISLTLK